ncbi:MAG: YnbE family lipoprotein [Myxococcota bacterium]
MTRKSGGALLALFVLCGCSPKVEVAAPKEPIVINLNVKIEHEIKVKVDEDLDDLFNDSEELFE